MSHPHDGRCNHGHHVTARTERESLTRAEMVIDRIQTDFAFRHTVDEATTQLMKAMPELAVMAIVDPHIGSAWMLVAGLAVLEAEEAAARG